MDPTDSEKIIVDPLEKEKTAKETMHAKKFKNITSYKTPLQYRSSHFLHNRRNHQNPKRGNYSEYRNSTRNLKSTYICSVMSRFKSSDCNERTCSLMHSRLMKHIKESHPKSLNDEICGKKSLKVERRSNAPKLQNLKEPDSNRMNLRDSNKKKTLSHKPTRSSHSSKDQKISTNSFKHEMCSKKVPKSECLNSQNGDKNYEYHSCTSKLQPASISPVKCEKSCQKVPKDECKNDGYLSQKSTETPQNCLNSDKSNRNNKEISKNKTTRCNHRQYTDFQQAPMIPSKCDASCQKYSKFEFKEGDYSEKTTAEQIELKKAVKNLNCFKPTSNLKKSKCRPCKCKNLNCGCHKDTGFCKEKKNKKCINCEYSESQLPTDVLCECNANKNKLKCEPNSYNMKQKISVEKLRPKKLKSTDTEHKNSSSKTHLDITCPCPKENCKCMKCEKQIDEKENFIQKNEEKNKCVCDPEIKCQYKKDFSDPCKCKNKRDNTKKENGAFAKIKINKNNRICSEEKSTCIYNDEEKHEAIQKTTHKTKKVKSLKSCCPHLNLDTFQTHGRNDQIENKDCIQEPVKTNSDHNNFSEEQVIDGSGCFDINSEIMQFESSYDEIDISSECSQEAISCDNKIKQENIDFPKKIENVSKNIQEKITSILDKLLIKTKHGLRSINEYEKNLLIYNLLQFVTEETRYSRDKIILRGKILDTLNEMPYEIHCPTYENIYKNRIARELADNLANINFAHFGNNATTYAIALPKIKRPEQKEFTKGFLDNVDSSVELRRFVPKEANMSRSIDVLGTSQAVRFTQSKLENHTPPVLYYERNKNPANIIIELIEKWCKSLPIYEQNSYEDIFMKQMLATNIMIKISDLNLNSEIFNNEEIYFTLISDEIDNQFSRLKTNSEFEAVKEWKKYQFIEALKSIKILLRGEYVRPDNINKLINVAHDILDSSFDITLFNEGEFNKVLDEIIEDYLELNFNNFDDGCKQIYRQKLQEAILNYMNNFNTNDFDSSTNELMKRNRLICELDKVPKPGDDFNVRGLPEVRIKNDINQLTTDLPSSNISEENKYKIIENFAERLNVIGSESDEISNIKINNEFKKMPKRHGPNITNSRDKPFTEGLKQKYQITKSDDKEDSEVPYIHLPQLHPPSLITSEQYKNIIKKDYSKSKTKPIKEDQNNYSFSFPYMTLPLHRPYQTSSYISSNPKLYIPLEYKQQTLQSTSDKLQLPYGSANINKPILTRSLDENWSNVRFKFPQSPEKIAPFVNPRAVEAGNSHYFTTSPTVISDYDGVNDIYDHRDRMQEDIQYTRYCDCHQFQGMLPLACNSFLIPFDISEFIFPEYWFYF